ncbi:hypothetical protein GGX14DRAFT_579268 [Mycena pura]|uniref:Uncharacterized protein n=1 Tax=Mycena pura TaxID=153505 RepID=A0AAD6UMU3_9AGAR|nr:hypothetical protein GGX14DRAFT_579268 [Mycena pura]
MPASKFQPAGSDSGAPQKFSGGSKDVQKVDKGKKRRSDLEERRAAEEEEEERLQATIAAREADLEAADSALAEQIHRRIERNEEERRELLRRQAALHSSRPWLPSVAPAATPTAPVVPVAPRAVPLAKRRRGRPRKSQEAPKVPAKIVVKKVAPPKIEYLARSSSGMGEEEDESLHESDESDKELEDGMKCEFCEVHGYPCVVPPKNNPTGRTACGSCHTKKIRCSLSPRKTGEVAPKKIVRRAPKPIRPESERVPVRRTRGAVQRGEIHSLEERLRDMDVEMAVLRQRLGYTYFAVLEIIKNFDNSDAEARRELFGRMLNILGQVAPEADEDFVPTKDGPPRKRPRIESRAESDFVPESESSVDTHVKEWRLTVPANDAGSPGSLEAEMPGNFVDVEMEIAMGPSGGAEETLAVANEIAGVVAENPGALPVETESAPEGERETAEEVEAENLGEGPTVVANIEGVVPAVTENVPVAEDIAEATAEITAEEPPKIKEEEEDFSMDVSQQAIISQDGQRYVPVWVPTRRVRKTAVIEPYAKGGQPVYKVETVDNVIPPFPPGPGTQDEPIEIEDDSEDEMMEVDSAGKKNDSEGMNAPK